MLRIGAHMSVAGGMARAVDRAVLHACEALQVFTRRRMYGVQVRTLEFLLNDHTPRFDFILGSRSSEACRAVWVVAINAIVDTDT